MNAEEVLNQRIKQLEADLKKTKDKLQKLGDDGGIKAVGYLVDIEKVKFAITQLYICLGNFSK